jgi:drug/metabolite transporter (DMT)-like permease
VSVSGRTVTIPSTTPQQTRGFLALAAAVTAWGIGWPVNRGILYHLPPLTGIGIRSAVATIALLRLPRRSGGSSHHVGAICRCCSAFRCCT